MQPPRVGLALLLDVTRPFRTVSPSRVRVPVPLWTKGRIWLLPLMPYFFSGLPFSVRLSTEVTMEEASVMLQFRPDRSTTSPEAAKPTAARRLPPPESLQLVTVMVAFGLASAVSARRFAASSMK